MRTTSTHLTNSGSQHSAGRARMRAVTQVEYGSSEILELVTIDRPTIGDDEVLIEVRAAGLDRGVWHLATGLPYLARLMGYGFRKPKQPANSSSLRRPTCRKRA